MSRLISALGLAWCAAMFALLTCALPLHAEDMTVVGVYRVTEPGGRTLQRTQDASGVALTRAGRPLKLSTAGPMADGDLIETRSDTAVQISYAPGHQVLILPGTRVRLGTLYLFIGELLIRARGMFHIETSFMTAGVEGTEFLVRAEGNGDKVDVIVTEGAVICRSNVDLWSPVRVAAAEQLRALAATSEAEPDGGSGVTLFRGPGNSKVQKQPARGSDLARMQSLSREMESTAP